MPNNEKKLVIKVPKQVCDPVEEAAELDSSRSFDEYDLRNLPKHRSLHIMTGNSMYLVTKSGESLVLGTNSKVVNAVNADGAAFECYPLFDDHSDVVKVGVRWRFGGKSTTSRVRSIMLIDDSARYAALDPARKN